MNLTKGAFLEQARVKYGLVLAGGMGLSFLGGFLCARRLAKAEMERKIAEEAENLREHYRAQAAAASQSRDKGERPPPVGGDTGEAAGADPARVITKAEHPEIVLGSRGTQYPIPYHTVQGGSFHEPRGAQDPLEGIPGDGDGDDDDDTAEDEAGPPVSDDLAPGTDTRFPYVISLAQFEGEFETHTKSTLTYYEGDKVLTDDKDQPIRDMVGVAGRNFAYHFGEDSEDPDILYVRNHRLESDFEITRNRGKYVDIILNYGSPQ